MSYYNSTSHHAVLCQITSCHATFDKLTLSYNMTNWKLCTLIIKQYVITFSPFLPCFAFLFLHFLQLGVNQPLNLLDKPNIKEILQNRKIFTVV